MTRKGRGRPRPPPYPTISSRPGSSRRPPNPPEETPAGPLLRRRVPLQCLSISSVRLCRPEDPFWSSSACQWPGLHGERRKPALHSQSFKMIMPARRSLSNIVSYPCRISVQMHKNV